MRLEVIKDLLHNMKGFFSWYFAPVVSIDYIYKDDVTYVCNNPMEDKYVYYWIGNITVGKWIRIKSIDILKDKYETMINESNNKRDKILKRIDKEIETRVLREKTIKDKIKRIIEEELTEDNYERED